MYITNSGLLYQHDAKNPQKSKWLSPNERKYADEWKDTKFEIETLFLLLMLDFPINSSAIVNLGGFFLRDWLYCIHQLHYTINCLFFLHSIFLKCPMVKVFHFATFSP